MTPNEALTVRVAATEQNIRDLWKNKASIRDVDALSRDFTSLTDEVRRLRHALLVFALTIAASAVGIAFAVLRAAA